MIPVLVVPAPTDSACSATPTILVSCAANMTSSVAELHLQKVLGFLIRGGAISSSLIMREIVQNGAEHCKSRKLTEVEPEFRY